MFGQGHSKFDTNDHLKICSYYVCLKTKRYIRFRVIRDVFAIEQKMCYFVLLNKNSFLILL